MSEVRFVSKRDGLFDASQHLEQIETMVEAFDRNCPNGRELESLDLFAGKGNFASECEIRGHSTLAVDVLYDKVHMDLLKETGFHFVLLKILTLDTCFQAMTNCWFYFL